MLCVPGWTKIKIRQINPTEDVRSEYAWLFSLNFIRCQKLFTHPLVLWTLPGWMWSWRLVFLVWSVAAVAPLVRMLTRPGVLWGEKGTRFSRAEHLKTNKYSPSAASIRPTYYPGVPVGVNVCLVTHVSSHGCWRCVSGLDLERMLLQVLLDDLEVDLSAGRGGQPTPGTPTSTQLHLRHVSPLKVTQQGRRFQTLWFSWTFCVTQGWSFVSFSLRC